ncbi:putative peroxisomal membrane protein PEX13 [Toxocara canis]|uniref:Peroxisomal membrane protein PEX13 n=1 Tax=Toxocara canis TaxID=6265 RepID=A0A0B2V0C3_TOXCA|nr:putative peroxisomal membrane protein PEX13 [Toxocara canis]
MIGMSGRAGDRPPPVPPRPPIPGEVMQHSIVGGPMNPYGMAYGYGPPYGASPYTTTTMYGNYGYGAPMDSVFARLAEESSRGVFQSIGTFVTAVTSVANMLSSTQNAIYTSFRAIIDVVEQFSRLKSQFISVVVTFSIFRWLKRVWHWILMMLRFKSANYFTAEMAWQDANVAPTGADWLASQDAVGKSINYSAMLFWLLALGGPFLIYICISMLVASVEESRKWATGSGEHYSAMALYDFTGQSERELSFRVGQTLHIAPKHKQPPVRGWLLASSEDGERVGLVPMNYVKVMSRKSFSPTSNRRSYFESAYENAFVPPS